MQKFMDEMTEQCNKISKVSKNLFTYSNALSLAGNEKLGAELWDMAECLYSIRDRIDTEVGRELDRQFKQSKQSSVNVLNAALAGAKLASKGKK